MTYVGVLDADLQAASRYKAGGIWPLFRQTRTEESLSLIELLSRTMQALRKVKVTSVATLVIDDVEVFEDARGQDDNLEAALGAAESVATDSASGISFSMMLTHERDDLWHVLTVEASVDHPADEAALTVLDTAKWLEGLDDEDERAEDSHESGFDAVDEGDAVEADIVGEEGPRGEELVEVFLQDLQVQLQKELALADPEIETWTDWDGEYDAEAYYASALPGVGA